MTAPLGTVPASNYPDRHVNMRGYFPATDYASAYMSRHSQNMLPKTALPCLKNLNCSYFSHPGGRGPTLLALKQHAQALTVLIRHLSISTNMGEIDAAHKDPEARAFQENEAFDWLNDLEKPYTNTDPLHHLPLTSLVNQLESQTDEGGPQFHCPLKEILDADGGKPDAIRKPYSTHHNLLMHASECLEVLDHEYSATGGIMSVLPTEDPEEAVDMKSARNSLVGQWLLFTQHLVARAHELETEYGKTLDLVAGEAIVPAQRLGRLDPSGIPTGVGNGREVAFPQDKWILANAGDDIFEHLHRLFDVQEGQYGERERIWRSAGLSGKRMWMEERGGEEWSRGIVALDIVTRYYRLKGSGHQSTIFVIPAWQFHPRCTATAETEKKPTVVAVPQPLWPTRVSDWEARNRKKLDEGEAKRAELATVTKLVLQQSKQIEVLKEEVRRERNMVKHYEGAVPDGMRESVRRLEGKVQRYREGLKALREVVPEHHQGLLDDLDELDSK
ncbi:hypothetical protein VUR80DRAFT_2141 [Thermomyces stellatus]